MDWANLAKLPISSVNPFEILTASPGFAVYSHCIRTLAIHITESRVWRRDQSYGVAPGGIVNWQVSVEGWILSRQGPCGVAKIYKSGPCQYIDRRRVVCNGHGRCRRSKTDRSRINTAHHTLRLSSISFHDRSSMPPGEARERLLIPNPSPIRAHAPTVKYAAG